MVGTVKVLEISKTYFNEVLSASEIVELAELYEQFTRKELVEAGIPKLIKTYIENVCMSTVILIVIIIDWAIIILKWMIKLYTMLDMDAKNMI